MQEMLEYIVKNLVSNPDAVEIKKNSGKLTVLSMPLSIVDLRKTVEIYVS